MTSEEKLLQEIDILRRQVAYLTSQSAIANALLMTIYETLPDILGAVTGKHSVYPQSELVGKFQEQIALQTALHEQSVAGAPGLTVDPAGNLRKGSFQAPDAPQSSAE